jgi:very-short-patch-repair endonuclease/predicted transcriptional regulator of viral defense system
MGSSTLHLLSSDIWRLVAKQHGVVARRQLIELGLSGQAIQHRLSKGRLHRLGRGVYTVGRPELSRRGQWMAAVLGCGSRAVLSYGSATALWGFGKERSRSIEISVPVTSVRQRPGVNVYRRPNLGPCDVVVRDGIPVTAVVRTLIDMATHLDRAGLERAINEADRLDLIDPEALLDALESRSGLRGIAPLRALLSDLTFRLTDSELERRFIPIALEAGLLPPLTRQQVNGFRVDFFWPDLGLVVETDGLRHHRTAIQQSRDRLRDQVHSAAGLTPLRFTHAQVRYEARWVRDTMAAVARRLGVSRDGWGGHAPLATGDLTADHKL